MADDRYNRWQGLGIAQLTVAVALISGLSVAGLGVGLALLQHEKFVFLLSASFKCAFAVALLLLFIAVLLSCVAVITRLLDFRLTARKVRKDTKLDYNKPLTMFWLGREAYGRITWGLFWAGCLSFAVGAVLLVVSIGAAYADRLH
jgi:hypothetical protein